MYSNVLLPRQWSRFACICRYSTAVEGQKLPQNSASSDGISPPLRIRRGPTDILEALAATVGPDPTAAHYKYHDDPYLIPLSNFRKRAYALSAEAGRRAAVWIRDNHAELFNMREWDPPAKMKTPHYNADPRIDAYAPKPIYTSESKVTEEDLQYTINNSLVEDSLQVFQLLGGVEGVEGDLRVKFLQLLCFYNEKEADSMEWMEERWFASNIKERQAATWRTGGLAEKIFASIEPKTSEAYCAIIQGMAKYYQAERAHMLAQEAIEKGLVLSTDVYNSLLSCVGFLKEGTTMRTEALKATLAEMHKHGISPNQGTLTACLRSVSAWGGGRALQQLALQLLAEFRQIGIQPGLSAYYYMLCLFCKERGPKIDILSTILADLESRETLTAIEPTDTNFFITAMGVCSDHLQDINMAERLHTLLMKGDNYKLVGDAYKESIYYRHYVTVACRQAPFEKTTELLDTLVPNVYVPEPTVFEEIIKTLELGGAGARLAAAWSQLVIFGHAKRVRLVERLLQAMCSCYQYQDDEVKAKTRAAAADILSFGQLTDEEIAQKRDQRTPQAQLSAQALTNIIQLCSDVTDKADPHWEAVSEAAQRLRKEAVGVPSDPAALAAVAQATAAKGKPGIAAALVMYLAENGFEEATTASASVLGTLLNRTESEVQQLLATPRGSLEESLHPSAAVLLDAYHLATTGVEPSRNARDFSSSDSDSDSSSDDE
ncbi:protein PTCD3 homolog, mitochondrial isoform X3 [Plutella xylostella]|uniref:protein PTCD3 homolog, mitochondrial isoform X1 n=1 Tax=Plutella xylostella TaxID=51655 RepID=UPI002032D1D9|nr:protein PTCD3 homolog, mitochondrial isoform X1 [Plutella xylostella]XP_048481129.1 protein PTCD3 homolog, mitochondrial isoform X2 [Plutella xylostella]XP_048481130.1 protein PTCD3 homolog, mitochondrial isoform X3 [Plutella xylostella]